MNSSNVLLVDDETTARDLLVRGLTRHGYHVTGAKDGLDAVALLHRPWDVIITDLVMPRMDGLQLLQEINRHCPRALRVVITSFADKDKVVTVLNLGADYLLEKPFGVERLADVVQRLLADRSAGPDQMVQFFQRRLIGLPLTPREREMVTELLKGRSNKEIAADFAIGEQSVKNMLSGIYAKLGVQSRTELFHAIFPL